MEKGFTLIELVVVITIIAVLSAIILFATTQYINKGKDSNISGNLAILVPAGEIYYNAKGSSYEGFCTSYVVKNAVDQIPVHSGIGSDCSFSVCCHVDNSFQSWVACEQEFTNPTESYCVDSRGVKKEILTTSCDSNTLTKCEDPAPPATS